MELFYTKNIEGKVAQLSEEESFHCIKILRHTTSDNIRFTDGEGTFYEGKIKEAHQKKCIVEIINQTIDIKKRNYFLHIAIAPTKSIDRMEFFVEKAVEIGIDEISFIKSARSERKDVKVERLNKIAIAAMKQSKKAFLPKINEVTSFKDFLNEASDHSENYIATLVDINQYAFQDLQKNTQTMILIGPEGDFSPDEVKLAIHKNIKPLSLGSNIYRTETAAIVACSWLSFINS